MIARTLFLIGLLAFAALLASSAAARDLVIDNVSGSDYQNDRGLVAGAASYGPYRTIGRALLATNRGDRIILTNTGIPYRECLSLQGNAHSGMPGFPFEIIGNGATLDGTTDAQADAWEVVRGNLYRYNSLRPGFAQLLLAGKSLPRHESTGLNLSQSKPGQWSFLHGYIYYHAEPEASPRDLPLEVTTESVGITLYDVEHVVIRDLIVRGYRLDGINAHDKATNIELIGIASRHNGRSGICVGGSSRVTIGSSLCELNGQSQLRSEGYSRTFLSNVQFPKSASDPITIAGGQVMKLPTNDK